MNKADYIRNLSFFTDFNEVELEKISEISLEYKYRKNMILFLEGEPGEAFYYIRSGKVKVFRTYEDGREHIVSILGPGEIFGEATLFNNTTYPASASVYEEAVIGTIKNISLEALIKNNPEMALKLLKVFARKLVFAQQKIKELTFTDVFARTSSQLFKLADNYGAKTEKGIVLNIKLSRQELAEMVGTTRETISRVIGRFKKERSISEEDDRIIIIDPMKLKKWV